MVPRSERDMFKTETAVTFFGDNRPPGIPPDAHTPDINLLTKRAMAIDSSLFPIQSLKKILDRE